MLFFMITGPGKNLAKKVSYYIDATKMNAAVVQVVDFSGGTVSYGDYTEERAKKDFKNFAWFDNPKRIAVKKDENGKYLEFRALNNGLTSAGAGIAVNIEPSPVTVMQTGFRFPEKTDFERGGKMFGLSGGARNSGGKKVNEYIADGFSARLIFRGDDDGNVANQIDGEVAVYVYHKGMAGTYGDIVSLIDPETDKAFQAIPGKWYQARIWVAMNTQDMPNGLLRVDLRAADNGDWKTYLNRSDMYWRDPESDWSGASQMNLHYFYGGATDDWIPQKNQSFQIRDIVLFTG